MTAALQQVPAVGRQPAAEVLLIGGLLGGLPGEVAETLGLVEDADLESPAAVEVLNAIRVAVAERRDVYGPSTVLDVLLRRGARPEVRRVLLDATTAGAATSLGALLHYAAMTVSLAFRRRVESVAHALREAADGGPEAVLTGQLDTAVDAVRGIAERLQLLRGSTP